MWSHACTVGIAQPQLCVCGVYINEGVCSRLICSQCTQLHANSNMSTPVAIEEADPDTCIQLYRNGLNTPILRRRLETASEEWVEQFIEGGGLEAILESLRKFGGTVEEEGGEEDEVVADPWLQCQCVEGIKELMSKNTGMEYMVNGGGWKHMETLVLRE